MKRRFRTIQEESGSALVAGIMILAIISMLGVVVAQSAIVQSHQTGRERAGEMAFNLAESALNAEASLLQHSWPTTSATAYPVCTQASTASATCPEGSISTGYNTTYAGSAFASPTWSVQVIDDNVAGVADTSYYSDAILSNSNLAHWDSSGPQGVPDNQLWIRADATIGGQHKILVASIGRQTSVVTLPQAVVTSGGLFTSNNGNHSVAIIDASDLIANSGLSGSVNVRCDGVPSSGNSNHCDGWDPSQLSPSSVVQTGYTDPNDNFRTLSAGVLEELRQTAQAQGTYYGAGQCPPFGAPGLVFIEDDTSNPCTYRTSGSWNAEGSPGAIIVATGTLAFLGSSTFHGIIYMANGQGSVPTSGDCTGQLSSNPVLTLRGGGAVYGGIFVDGCGTVDAGSSGYDIRYDSSAFSGVKTYESPSLALNTFKIVGNS